MTEFGRVQAPWWYAKPVAIVGGGLSLAGFDLSLLRDRFYVCAVNGSMFDLPWADAGCSMDRHAYASWSHLLPEAMPVFWAVYESFKVVAQPKNVTFLKRRNEPALSNDPEYLHAGTSSGYAALNYVFLKRPQTIVLLGFDYDGGGRHWNDGHYADNNNKHGPAIWRDWARAFDDTLPQLKAANIEVINGCENSGITAYPRCKPQEAIAKVMA